MVENYGKFTNYGYQGLYGGESAKQIAERKGLTDKDEILDYVGHDIELEIVPDYTLNENACTIETDAGIFDCGVDVQLDNLMKDIKALCS